MQEQISISHMLYQYYTCVNLNRKNINMNKNMQTVYKVVAVSKNNTYLSCMYNNTNALKYKIGKKTKPRYKGWPIFAFKTKQTATWFMHNVLYCKAVVLGCTGEISPIQIKKQPAKMPRPHTKIDTYAYEGIYVPKGTILCSSVIPHRVCSITKFKD